MIDFAAVAQRQRRQAQAGCPAFCPLCQRRKGVIAKDRVDRSVHEYRRLFHGETQIVGPDLGHLVAHSQLPQPQRRLSAREEHQMQPSEGMPQQSIKQTIDVRIVDFV